MQALPPASLMLMGFEPEQNQVALVEWFAAHILNPIDPCGT
jgi:hypothetical protein